MDINLKNSRGILEFTSHYQVPRLKKKQRKQRILLFKKFTGENPKIKSNTQINQKLFSGQDKLYIQKPNDPLNMFVFLACICLIFISFFCNKKKESSTKEKKNKKEKLFGEVGWWFLNAI